MYTQVLKRQAALCMRTVLASGARPPTWEVLARRQSSALAGMSPEGLVERMLQSDVRRGYVLRGDMCEGGDDSVHIASHAALQPLADFMNDPSNSDNIKHTGFFLELSARTNHLMGAFLWWTHRGQGCGGIRLQPYPSLEAYIRDGLRLALGMGRKSALAGLWSGGGKGVIVKHPGTDVDGDPVLRRALFEDYGKFLTSLQGCYVAAEDAGTFVHDVDVVFEHTRYTTCISPSLGGSGNPSVPTAAGVVAAMQGAVDWLGPPEGLQGRTVAIQGVGNVGRPLIKFLLEKGVKHIVAVEQDEARLAAAKAEFADHVDRVQLQHPSERSSGIHTEEVDIFSPCGFGAVLNDDTIPEMRARIVCGAANNQLELPRHADALAAQGIHYVPDFVANRMGIVNCANEHYGRVGDAAAMEDPAVTRHFSAEWENSVYNVTQSVLQTAHDKGITSAAAADMLADEAAQVPHPIWGADRPSDIVRSLVARDWVAKAPPASTA